mgnify:CR=1 FL=1
MSNVNLEKYLTLEYTKENMLDGVKKSWKKFIKKEMEKEYFDDIFNRIKKDQNNGKLIFPFPNKVFETLKYTKRSDLKCVIIGQDPYINYQLLNLLKLIYQLLLHHSQFEKCLCLNLLLEDVYPNYLIQ